MFQCGTFQLIDMSLNILANHLRHITIFQNRCYFKRRLPYRLRSITTDFNWASNELVDM